MKKNPIGRIVVRRGSVAELAVPCIVDPTDPELSGKGLTDQAVQKAGGRKLVEACRKIGHLDVGEVAMTDGYQSDADHIIFTVGPQYTGKPQDLKDLAACYINILELVKEKDIHQVVIPAISCGGGDFPIEKAAPLAIETIRGWLKVNPDYSIVVFVIGIIPVVYEAYWQYLMDHPH